MFSVCFWPVVCGGNERNPMSSPKFEVDMGDDEKKSFHMIPDQFEVKPLDQILQRKRFLPMPRLLRLELERQEEERRRVADLMRGRGGERPAWRMKSFSIGPLGTKGRIH